MQREVNDQEGTAWTCTQAYAGLGVGEEEPIEEHLKRQAQAKDGSVEVVCTPSGGMGTIRLELEADWEEQITDEELVRKIEAARK